MKTSLSFVLPQDTGHASNYIYQSMMYLRAANNCLPYFTGRNSINIYEVLNSILIISSVYLGLHLLLSYSITSGCKKTFPGHTESSWAFFFRRHGH